MPALRSERDGRILTLTIDREERRNALNAEVLDGLLTEVTAAATDPAIGALVLTGAGDRAFCAGADLATMQPDASKLELHRRRGVIVDVIEALQRCGKPVVARVNGAALAGGFGLFCACDLSVAADDATFGLPEIRSGLWPFVVSAIVRAKVPEALALELMMTGRRIDAAEAARWGIVNRVVPRDRLDEETRALAERVADTSAVAMRLGKDSWAATRGLPLRPAMEHLHATLGLCLESEDVVEGVTAFFEKRPPVWKHR